MPVEIDFPIDGSADQIYDWIVYSATSKPLSNELLDHESDLLGSEMDDLGARVLAYTRAWNTSIEPRISPSHGKTTHVQTLTQIPGFGVIRAFFSQGTTPEQARLLETTPYQVEIFTQQQWDELRTPDRKRREKQKPITPRLRVDYETSGKVTEVSYSNGYDEGAIKGRKVRVTHIKPFDQGCHVSISIEQFDNTEDSDKQNLAAKLSFNSTWKAPRVEENSLSIGRHGNALSTSESGEKCIPGIMTFATQAVLNIAMFFQVEDRPASEV